MGMHFSNPAVSYSPMEDDRFDSRDVSLMHIFNPAVAYSQMEDDRFDSRDVFLPPLSSNSDSPGCRFGFESPRFPSVDGASLLNCQPQDVSRIKAGAGLENLGNTCFLNSILQCFMHTSPLLNRIFSNKQLMHSRCNDEEFCVMCDLKELIELSVAPFLGVLRPFKFLNNLNHFSSCFQKYQQEDAHEFLQCFLDKLESSLESNTKDFASSHRENIVKEVFGGRLVSKLKCCSCGHLSDTYEPSIDLSLEIEDVDTFEAALQSFTKLEKIEDLENKFTCDNCKEQVFVEKQLSFDEAPLVAIFHLKRFKNDGYFGEKIDKHVAFPMDVDLLPFTSSGRMNENDVELKYILYAIVVHAGEALTFGHYYCFIRISQNIWYKFDDSKVVKVDEEFVLSQEAYILFYSKAGTPWFSSFSETLKPLNGFETLSTSPTSVLENKSSPSPSPELDHSAPELENGDAEWSGIKVDVPMQSCSAREAETERERETIASEMPSVSLHDAETEASPCLAESPQFREIPSVASCQNETPETNGSQGLEIYREDPPDAAISLPRDHPRSVHMSCRRRLRRRERDRRQAPALKKRTFKPAKTSRKKSKSVFSAGPNSLRPLLSGSYR